MKYLLRFYDGAALCCFFAMMGCVLIEVASRNIFYLATPWAEEASRLFCVWSVFLGAASAWARGSHIVIDIVPRRLRGRTQLALRLFIQIVSGIFIVSIAWGTLSIMKISYPSKTTALEISISYFYLGLCIGLFGILAFHSQIVIRTVAQFFEPEKDPTGKD
jgi:TRAP-type C4-dicarboxylate transport system permease small subunit